LTFDLLTSGSVHSPAMDYMSTNFGADSSSHFLFTAWTNRRRQLYSQRG